jgi:hypothetical protein
MGGRFMIFSVLMLTTAAEIFLASSAKVSGGKAPGARLSAARDGGAMTHMAKSMTKKRDFGFWIIE